MAKYDIYKKRSMEADIATTGLKFVLPPKMTFEVEADFDAKVFEQVKKDTVMLKDMNQAVPGAAMYAYDKVSEKVLDKTFLAD